MSASEPINSPTIMSLTADYSSPSNNSFMYTTNLSAPATTKPSDRAAYLSSLRNAVADMQQNINRELTARMEEDKVRDAVDNGANRKVVDEAKEEDNYGEEVPEED